MTTTSLPPALVGATLLLLPERDGFLALMPTEGAGVPCPRCNSGRAMGLAVLRQSMTTGRWTFCCIGCDSNPIKDATAEPVASEATNG
jgi:hypothetical protein